MKHTVLFAAAVLLLANLHFAPLAPASDSIWDIEAVNETGNGTHPKVGADIGADPATSENRVTVTGIALNATDEYLDPNSQWQVYIQAESPEKGGIAAWAGKFYNSEWPRYPADIAAGDRIQVNGFLMDARGKININERHSAAPGMQFVVTKLASGVGMPTPIDIANLSTCNTFDQTRATGGERYQAQWVRFVNVHYVSGTWANGQTVVVADETGNEMNMLLSARGDFDGHVPETGSFNATGIFDQEDLASPFTDSYRLWVKRQSDIVYNFTAAQNWEAYE